MASEIRVNKIQNRSGLSTVTFSDTGAIVSGIVTANSFSGNLSGNLSGGTINATSGTITGNLGVGGVLTYEDVTNIDSIGIITARNGLQVINGSVGIGTTNSGAKLEIHSNTIPRINSVYQLSLITHLTLPTSG